MNGWAIAFIAIMACRVSTNFIKHGELKQKARHNGWTVLWVTVVDALILMKAGLFS